MIGIFMLALCVGVGVANEQDSSTSMVYSCPPESVDVRAFREMADVEKCPTEIPTLEQAERDLSNESQEMRSDVGNRSNLRRVLYTSNLILPYCPYVRWCCPAPTYDCTSVDIHIWYLYYGNNGFCFVVHPSGNNVIKRKKCTCVKCLYRDMYCPTIGRCVETSYQWQHALIYCPWSQNNRRFFTIALLVPRECYCRPYCPWYHFVAAKQTDRADGS